ncbi:hypothetical protein [Sediminicola luteus]|nr:hypothetical protein [Sediminicola luteus]
MTTASLKYGLWILGCMMLCLSCSKTEEEAPLEDVSYLQFETKTNTNGTKVLYSEWVDSELPNSSVYGAAFCDLPKVKKSLFDIDRDLVMFFAKRNSIMPLPVSIPVSREHYMVEMAPHLWYNIYIPRIRVTATDWETEPLDDIFFSPNNNTKFRIMIIPGNTPFPSKGTPRPDFTKMDYAEICNYFGIPQ